jgi:anti-sigma factor RsiW
MTRLELIMTRMNKAEASELLSAHIDGDLTAAEQAEVDGWLAEDSELAKERSRLVATIALLQQLPPPPGPDVVAAVRQRLSSPAGVVVAPKATPTRLSMWMPRLQGVAAGLAMAAGIGGIALISTQHAGPVQVTSAGVADDMQARTTLVVVGVDLASIAHVAAAMNLSVEIAPSGEVAVRGAQRTIAQLVLQVKADAAGRGASVAGVLPQADRIEVIFTDHAQPAD